MKKAILTLLITLCLFASSLKDYRISAMLDTGVILHVPKDFTTIQEAINNASPGDTILVHMGTYYEHVIINKSIALVGENRDFTTIDGNGTDSVISIRDYNVSIKDFTIKKSGPYPNSGIYVERFEGNVICHNKIINSREGISFYFSNNNFVYDNILSSNYYGINLFYSSNNTLLGNTISSSNYDGINLFYSSNNIASDNIIVNNNLAGVRLHYSSNNIICGNIISGNSYGIGLLLSSSNNTIYHNNFDNADQVLSDSTNVWNYGDEGNHWSDYAGRDLNEDGIGDYPYVIDENNQDSRPLMGFFFDFNVTLERETYHVTIISNSTISNFKFDIGNETGNKLMRFNVAGVDGPVGFSRVTIPIELMKYPYTVLVDGVEIIPTSLNITDETKICFYFTYFGENCTITIISSEMLRLYYELLARYSELQGDLYSLNGTYYSLLANYTKMQTDLDNVINLLGNYSGLQIGFNEMIMSYQKHLLDYSEQMMNIRSLMYIFAVTAAIFIMTTIYLSKHAHARISTKTKVIEGEE